LKTVKDLRRLTGVLLDTSLLEGGKLQPFAAVDLRAVIETVLDRWRPTASARQIELKWETNRGEFLILGNEELVDVAISNLVDNAIKYSEEKSQVELQLAKLADGSIRFQIKDKGVGMNAQELEKLGDIFFRADISRSTKDSFGLGFANAKKIIQSHGARLSVVSEPKVGTAVNILWDPLPKNFRNI
ncbi:MAG: ATP-binding protein, partial [Proteobacteria bacterium]